MNSRRFSIALALVALTLTAPARARESYDLIIASGRVVDGTGAPWFRADVGVRAGRIAAVGDLTDAKTARRIEAHGLIVAPGFIDVLGQSELALLLDNRAESKIRQGITSEITGEGNSAAPANALTIAEIKPYLDHYHLKIDWTDLKGYFARLRRQKIAINLGTYVGAAQVREMVVGLEDTPPTPTQLLAMQRLVAEAMDQGALGLSSALIYAPGSFAKTAELIALASAAGKRGGIYATHMRSEGAGELAALDEAIQIGREAHIPVEIFHLKASGKPNWGHMRQLVARIASARDSGVDIAADMYPYIAAGTGLDATIPNWAHEGGVEKMIARFAEPATRARIVREMERGTGEEWFRLAEPHGILVATVLQPELKKWAGKRVDEIARAMGQSPASAILDLVAQSHASIDAIYFSMSEDDVQEGLKQPWISIGLDSGAMATDGVLANEGAHPRGFGSMARLIGHYARDLKLFSVEEAVRKVTSLPASRHGLHDRGLLRPGMAADVTIFDPTALRDLATFEDAKRYAEGVHTVLVNGRVVLDEGKLTGERPGTILTHQ